jgi:hypothetical protein
MFIYIIISHSSPQIEDLLSRGKKKGGGLLAASCLCICGVFFGKPKVQGALAVRSGFMFHAYVVSSYIIEKTAREVSCLMVPESILKYQTSRPLLERQS